MNDLSLLINDVTQILTIFDSTSFLFQTKIITVERRNPKDCEEMTLVPFPDVRLSKSEQNWNDLFRILDREYRLKSELA